MAILFVLGNWSSAVAQTDPPLRGIVERYWDAVMERYPAWATEIGDHRFNDRLQDLSEDARVRWKDALKSFLKQLQSLSSAELAPTDRLTRELLERVIQDALLEHAAMHRHYLSLEPLDGPHLKFPLLLVSQPFRNAKDFDDYISRLRGFPKQVDDLMANLRKGISLGVAAPLVTTEKVVPQIRTHVISDPTKSEFYKPVAIADALEESDRTRIVQGIEDAIRASVVPTYARLLEFVEKDYLPACREKVGIGAVPGGDKMYEELASLSATFPVKPHEVHALGLAEVERIRGEMVKVQQQVGFTGTLDQFLEHMRSDRKHRFNSDEELVAAADAILQRTKPLMTKLFTRLPKADIVMKEIEPFRAPASPVGYYNPSPEDGSRPGYYYINTYAPQERLRFTLEALTYHEAIPGHHFQMALDQENKDLPKFRRYASFTAYVEGWALYTEKLGYEIGGYPDAYARFGQLTFEMWRACRLVVDTGMHANGWSRDQAIEFMARNTSLARVDIENEIDRYISWPGQALAYKLGELRILEMRHQAEKTLGEKFDLRAFHDALLSGGAMPIDILESRMREWVTRGGR
jgi:prolyl oligopeptidase